MSEPAGVSTAAPPAHTRGRVTERTVLVVASFGAFLAFLDATIVNVAFPSIRESFAGASHRRLSWVLNAYNIVFAAFLILFGRMADLVGRRRLFALGDRRCSPWPPCCARPPPSVWSLVAARVVQALGAAHAHPRLARAGDPGLPGRAARPRGGAVGRDRRGSPPGSGHRSAARW